MACHRGSNPGDKEIQGKRQKTLMMIAGQERGNCGFQIQGAIIGQMKSSSELKNFFLKFQAISVELTLLTFASYIYQYI